MARHRGDAPAATAGSARRALHMLWAVAVGASVTVQLCCSVLINRRSAEPGYHAFYVANLSVLLGGVALVPHAAVSSETFRGPKRWWSVLGGLWTLPSFVGIPAGALLGIQLVLLSQLLAMLGTALLFDLRRGRVHWTDATRMSGFLVVLGGVATDNFAFSSTGSSLTPLAALLLCGSFASGVGYAVQAKCNARLARDVGNTPRAVVISALVNIVAGLPLDLFLLFGKGVRPVADWRDWPLWVFAGAQSAFYIGSLAQLPRELGYTTSYLTLLLGKLISSSFVDALGLAGKVVPFEWKRGLAIALVLVGTALFSGSPLPCAERPAPLVESLSLSVAPCDELHAGAAKEATPGGVHSAILSHAASA